MLTETILHIHLNISHNARFDSEISQWCGELKSALAEAWGKNQMIFRNLHKVYNID